MAHKSQLSYRTMNILERILEGSMEPTNLPLSLLENITDNFSDDRIIGRGGFGTVYKGILTNGIVAVKRISNSQTIDEKFFHREVNSLMEVKHRNIVRVLGFCSSAEHRAMKHPEFQEMIFAMIHERLLCFEYIGNGSLDKYITDELRGLEWDTRFHIIKGICAGLHYLHMEKRILHLDLKTANVLLDNQMTPKITDFGLSKYTEDSYTICASRFSQLGYSAPEYLNYGKMSVKADMYSLGVIIIELVTGLKDIPADNSNILRRWRHRWNKSVKAMPLAYQEQIIKCIEIGLLCKKTDPYERPSTSDIMREFGGETAHYWEDDMLGVEPLELQFAHSEHNNKKILSCSVELSNYTRGYIAFMIQTDSPLPYSIKPNLGFVQPYSEFRVNITLDAADPQYLNKAAFNMFIVRSMKVNGSLSTEDINEDMFYKHTTGHNVDEVHLSVAPCSKENFDDEESILHLESNTSTLLSSLEINDQAIELKTLVGILNDANANPSSLSYPFIKSITRNFSQEIGRGGFGIVYLGDLGTSKVAVKKLPITLNFSEAHFRDEIKCLIRTKHSNIVRFLGYCADTYGEYVPFDGDLVLSEVPQRLLCFEYVPNGNLQKYLKDTAHKDPWPIRYQILRGICHGLNYLHDQRIIHLDLKPDNILLDAHMNPKITDFGISRCIDEGVSRIYTVNVRGTKGSIAPETIDSGEITFKSDIYGLGNIIIHLLTGRNKYDFENWHTSLDLDGPQVRSCTEIAKSCVAFDEHKRPTIGEIMKRLNEIERL